jgi:hypothetical protein
MSDKEIRICTKCRGRYVVHNDGDCYPGGKEREEIYCPCCSHLDGYLTTSGRVRTEKLEDETIRRM